MTLTWADSWHYGYLIMKLISYLNKTGDFPFKVMMSGVRKVPYQAVGSFQESVTQENWGQWFGIKWMGQCLLSCNINKYGSGDLAYPGSDLSRSTKSIAVWRISGKRKKKGKLSIGLLNENVHNWNILFKSQPSYRIYLIG